MIVHAPTTPQDVEHLTALFKLLSDKTRLHILLLLADGERNVTNLCEALGLPQPTVSHHLGLLRSSSLIANRRHGKQIFYTLDGRVRMAGSDLQLEVGNLTVSITARIPS
jgi:DNA-binding transcriptional ArsR family regulator